MEDKDGIIYKALCRAEDTPEINFFVIQLFKDTPLSFYKYQSGWFHFCNEGEIAFRFNKMKKIGSVFSYRIELNFKPKNTAEFNINHEGGDILMNDFMCGVYGSDDVFEFINIRLYKYDKIPDKKELLFELILK